MTAVGEAAFDMINEIRRQFREIPGLLEGTAEPDTATCVDIATTAALRQYDPARSYRRERSGVSGVRPGRGLSGWHAGRRTARLRAAGTDDGQRGRRLG